METWRGELASNNPSEPQFVLFFCRQECCHVLAPFSTGAARRKREARALSSYLFLSLGITWIVSLKLWYMVELLLELVQYCFQIY